MGFTVEQECPQCGAPIELDETDRIMLCPYCGVKNFLFAPRFFRFLLPHKAPERDIIYAPYLRVKGNVFFCHGINVSHRFLDITRLGISSKYIPVSLGVRPQAMKLKFISPDTRGSFLKFSADPKEMMAKAVKQRSCSLPGRLLHNAFIGETISLVYLPLYIDKGKLFDAVLNRPVQVFSEGFHFSEDSIEKNTRRWRIMFLATLCPGCGWNLQGEKDSAVMICRNCDSAWEASEGKFVQVDFSVVPGSGNETVYLPFWKISVNVSGVEINSFGDFVRVTNQPRILEKKIADQDMSFWCPAFRIRPGIFLNLARHATISQDMSKTVKTLPGKSIFPATLPKTEALQSMKVTLASSAMNKTDLFPLLPKVRFKITASMLVFMSISET
ncbi:MAG TPA: zinc ribbon domain-containing protein [Desulfobacteraceae bacterium]|nr:zinc ribbon domain-containing protein [Desulfobacteraceae bacterium]